MTLTRPGQIYAFGDFRVDVARRELLRRETSAVVPLATHAFEVLLALVRRPHQLVGRTTLMALVWPHVTVVDNSLSQAVAAVRRALGDDPASPRHVETVAGRGYRFRTDVVAEDRSARDPQAYQLYAVGWSALTRPDGARLEVATRCLEAAVSRDPGFAMAWVCLAEAYFMVITHGLRPVEEIQPLMLAAIRHALQLAPNCSEAHAMHGKIVEHTHLDWRRGAQNYRRALELNPNCYWAQRLMGLYLIHCGRFDEAIGLFHRCQEVEPLAVNLNGHIGMALYYGRRYPEAVEQLELTLGMDPSFAVSRGFLGRAFLRLGRFERALTEFETASSVVHAGPSDIPVAWALMGRTQEARSALESLIANDKPYDSAAVCAALGDLEQAMDWLERAAEARVLGFVAVDPCFDALRPTARFQQLVQRLGVD